MSSRPEGERRRRRRYDPVRLAVVGAWLVAAVGVLVASHGPFWRDVDYWMDRARAHAEAGEWADALHNVGRALDGAPGDPGILTFAGHVHRELQQWPAAADRFEQALTADPGRPEAALGLAEARLELNDAEGAAHVLGTMRVAATEPAQVERAAGLAEQAGRPDIALELLESVPSADNRLERVRLARAGGQHDKAVALLGEALAHAPAGSHGQLRRDRALALEDAGRTDDARSEYEALHRNGLLDGETGVRYAWMLNEAGRHTDALGVLADTPSSPEVHELAARTALWADDPGRARVHLTALSEDPSADVAELRNLLRDHELRRAAVAAAAEAARLRDTPPTDPAEALDFWRVRLAEDPSDGIARAEVVALLEADGRFGEARATLLAGRSVDAVAADGGDEVRHVARLSLWMDRPEDAARVLQGLPPEILGPSGRFLLSQALLESGDPEGAYRALGTDNASTADAMLLHARVMDASGRPGEAADRLAELSRSRELTPDEAAWWAGLLWRSGGLEGALAHYEGLLEIQPEDPGVLRSIGDLRSALGDPEGAERAYRSVIGLRGPGDPAGRGLALALLRQDRPADAITAYEEYLAETPEDAEARLALARALAETGAFERATGQYERYAAAADVAVDAALAHEIASAWMATGDFERAEPWARRAARSSEPLSRVRLAHVLALLSRYESSGDVLDRLEEDGWNASSDLENALVEGWVHRLRGRPLAAIRTVGDHVDPTDTSRTARDAWVFLAEVSEARGDVAHAREMVRAGEAAGARSGDVGHVTSNLDARAQLRGAAGGELGSDANRLDVGTVWARIGLRPASGSSPALGAELRHREASQLDADRGAAAFTLAADSLFVTRALRLDTRIGLEASRDGGTRLVGGIGGTLETLAGNRWSLEATREPVWAEGRRSGVPEYGRVRDLGTLDPGLMATEARVAATKTAASPTRWSAHAEVGASRYSDGNRRTWGYGETAFPVRVSPAGRLAVVPNVYAEGFASERISYATPSHFLALGLAAEGERVLGDRLSLGGRANPHYFRFAGADGLGVEARAWLAVATRAGEIRLAGRYLQQGDLYDLFRLSTEVAFPLRGAP